MPSSKKSAYTCSTCRYFAQGDGQASHCRRYPPLPLSAEQSSFALTREDVWCGEWNKVLKTKEKNKRKNIAK